ncbi:putative Late nodulin [Medicago truncatula]|uniref:Putative Late nodulin n=1 Tax=Medicago truncatula TaxID=3880 RepID=A0A396GHV2_MEDTR|nr:putative Late nodulin [Medicago truncatula]
MVQIVKYFYVILIFLSLFVVAMNGDYLFECTSDHDCEDVGYCPDTFVAKCFVSFALSQFLSKGKCLCV